MSGGIPRVQNTLPYQLMSQTNQNPTVPSYGGNNFQSLGVPMADRYGGFKPASQMQSPLGQYRNFPVTNPYQAMFQNQLRQPPQQYMQSSPYLSQMKYEPPAPMRFGGFGSQNGSQSSNPSRGLIFDSDPYNQ